MYGYVYTYILSIAVKVHKSQLHFVRIYGICENIGVAGFELANIETKSLVFTALFSILVQILSKLFYVLKILGILFQQDSSLIFHVID